MHSHDDPSVTLGVSALTVAAERERVLQTEIGLLTAQVARLRAFAEEMSWYCGDEEWDDAAERLLKYGDVQNIADIRAESERAWHRRYQPCDEADPIEGQTAGDVMDVRISDLVGIEPNLRTEKQALQEEQFAAVERERALREEVDALKADNQCLRDRLEAWASGAIESAWRKENHRLRAIIDGMRQENSRLYTKCNRLIGAVQRLSDDVPYSTWRAVSPCLVDGALDPEPQSPTNGEGE